jgi:predicted metal-dependent phosphoesterase TrpH
VLIDLHCHTQLLSACSSLGPEELARLAAERGLDAICLTEHDRAWDADMLAAFRARVPIPVFHAVELTTDLGHVLAFGLPPDGFSASAAEVAAAARRAGALLFLAHPARDGLLRVTRETVEYFASVEAANGSDSRLQNIAAAGLAKGFRIPGIGGSDAHTPAEVGRAATRFDGPIRTDRELLEALHAGAYAPTWLD